MAKRKKARRKGAPAKTPWMNTQCAAEALGVTRATVVAAIEAGLLHATRYRARGGKLYPIMDEGEVERFRRARAESKRLQAEARKALAG